MLIAFQGETGAYSEAAAGKFDPAATFLPCPAFEDVFAAVEAGRATCGVLPDRELDRRHHPPQLRPAGPARAADRRRGRAAGPSTACWRCPGTPFEDLKQVYSHPQALAQCDRFLRSLKGVEVVATYDTAGSAKLIRERSLAGVGAIASERAAAVFGLDMLKAGIQDYADNITRFLVVTRAGRASPRFIGGRAGQQDHHRLHAAQHAGRAVQGAERVRAARNRRHQDRIAADRPPLGIPVLPGPRRRAARAPVRPRARRTSPSSRRR